MATGGERPYNNHVQYEPSCAYFTFNASTEGADALEQIAWPLSQDVVGVFLVLQMHLNAFGIERDPALEIEHAHATQASWTGVLVEGWLRAWLREEVPTLYLDCSKSKKKC